MTRLKGVFTSKRNIIIALIAFLAIGFAAVTTTLVLRGNTVFGTNTEDFDVYFSKAVLDGVESNDLISQDGKSITYETAILEKVGDESILEYTITNNSTQYDAAVSINCELETNDYVRVDNSLGDNLIEAQSEGDGSLTAHLFKTSVDEQALTVTCTIIASAVELGDGAGGVIDPDANTPYSVYGELVDGDGNSIDEETIVIYPGPTYTTIDESGYFYMDEIKKGSLAIYLMGSTTTSEIEGKTEDEIAAIATTKAEITTNTVSVAFENGYKFNNLTIAPTEKVDVTINYNDGTTETVTKTLAKGMKYTDLVELTRTGYEFLGWFDEDDNEYNANTIVTLMDNHEITAKWKVTRFTVTLNGNGVTVDPASIEVDYNDTYGELPTLTRTGYEFLGWYNEDDELVTSSTIMTLEKNHTLTAKWDQLVITEKIYINGELVDEYPSSDIALFVSASCENGTSATWDATNWQVIYPENTKDTCTVNFNANAADYITALSKTNTTTMNTSDPDKNPRYMGADPSNYVEYNDELWRIIGVFSVTNASGTSEKRVKLIRADNIGLYSWDSSASSVNGGAGVSQWGPSGTHLGADIMLTLNSTYLTGGTGTCYGGSDNATKACVFGESSGQINPLSTTAQSLIESAVWPTGSNTSDWGSTITTDTASKFYAYERNKLTTKLCSSGTYCNDNIARTGEWTGLVGLVYPSDYGYSSAGSGTQTHSTCANAPLHYWRNSGGYNYTACPPGSWIYKSGLDIYTMIRVNYSNYSYPVFYIRNTGYMGNNSGTGAATASAIYPVVYLKADVKLTDGNGTSGTPYKIGL